MHRAILPIALMILTSLAACGGGSPAPTGQPTPSETIRPATTLDLRPTPSPTPTQVPTSIPGSIELTRGEDIRFPDDMAFIVETGCWHCDGGPGILYRVYADGDGRIVEEQLIWPERLGYDSNAFVNGFAFDSDASTIVVSLCIEGPCGAGGFTEWNANSVSALLLSTDGGVAWSEITRSGPALHAIGLVEDRNVLTVNYLAMLDEIEYRIYPEGKLLEPPTEVAGDSYAYAFTVGGQVFWRTTDGAIFDTTGSRLTTPDGGFAPRPPGTGVIVNSAGSILIGGGLSDGLPHSGLPILELSGDIVKREALFRSQGMVFPAYWQQDEDSAVVSIEVMGDRGSAPKPAILDLLNAEYGVIEAPFPGSDQPWNGSLGRAIVHAVQFGPFARVTGTGSCLNLRAEPSLSAQVLTCLADGVLLTDSGETRVVDGTTWVRITTPAHTEGWASAAFLER